MTARATSLLLLLAGLAALAAFARPAAGGPEGAVPRIVFPLVAKTLWWDSYGDPRPNGRHTGIDIEAPWRAPVVAVEPGRVEYGESSLGGCMLYLHGRSGTTYMYIHLNNDVNAVGDNRGRCHETAYTVPQGARVAAGEQVAWNGDSGDAEGNPHLHFEVHPNGGSDVSPYLHLKRATHPLFAAKPGSTFSLALRGKLLSSGPRALTLDVERVRHYPGGRWLEIDKRLVKLAVPVDADVSPVLLGDAAMQVRRSTVAPAAAVVAHTLKGRTTSAAIVGASGALRVSRVAPVR
jgi:Peptidase family M23